MAGKGAYISHTIALLQETNRPIRYANNKNDRKIQEV